MDSTSLIRAVRAELDDTIEPYFISDARLLRYIDEAQKMFCRIEGGIPDIIDVPYQAGDEHIPLSGRILKIRSAQKIEPSGKSAIPVLNVEDVPRLRGVDDYGAVPNGAINSAPGSVQGLVIGAKHGALMLHPTSAEDAVIRLFVFRTPLTDITDLGQEFEIAEQHHYSLSYWVKHLVLSTHDSEVFGKEINGENKVKFLEYCNLAKRDRERLEHKPRSVAYGGY